MRSMQQRVERYIDDDGEISAEQRAAIRSGARLTIVRACPGSGKTRAFAARFAWDVATSPNRRSGVAAISFTNVAQAEVRKRVRALEIPDGYPHFVGTIDAFLLRYVVRRFGGGLVNLRRFSHPVPDRDYSMQSVACEMNSGKLDRLSAFRVDADANGTKTVLHVGKDFKVSVLPTYFANKVIEAKKLAWQQGELTHSDVVAVAWHVLSSKAVSRIVAGRFPRILVDEFQDTTGVRERCLRLLVQSDAFERAFVVGDPDQCIMEFAGANPTLFDEFESIDTDLGRHEFTRCYRFHERIAAVTAPLRASRIAVTGLRAVSERAATVLLTHSFSSKPKDGVVAAVTAHFTSLCKDRGISPGEGIVLSWSDADVQRLGGLQKKRMPLGAPSYAQVMGAIRGRSQGQILDAFRRTERLLAQLVFKNGRPPSDDDLGSRGIDRRMWRAAVMSSLDAISGNVDGETVGEWATRIKEIFERAFEFLTGTYQKLGKRFRQDVEGSKKLLASLATDYLPDVTTAASAPVSNIHQVKGQEFPAVCVYVPADRSGMVPADPVLLRTTPAPPDTMSARRVLYVGATRAHDLLVVVIPESWIEALEQHEQGRTFLGGFDVRAAIAVP